MHPRSWPRTTASASGLSTNCGPIGPQCGRGLWNRVAPVVDNSGPVVADCRVISTVPWGAAAARVVGCARIVVVRDNLVAKLRPDRFSAMSGRMAAIIGYIVDERLSDPAISELVVTSDGFGWLSGRARSAPTK